MGTVQAARPSTNVATPSRSATPLPLHDRFSISSTLRQDLQQQVPCHTCSAESYPTIPFQHPNPSTTSIASTLTASSIGPKPKTFDTKPILPSEVMGERYTCSPQRPRSTKSKTFMIPAKTRDFTNITPPQGWTHCTHPEGAAYLFYQDPEMYIFTRGDGTNQGLLAEVVECARQLYDRLDEKISHPAGMTELFLAVNEDPAVTRAYIYNYYFVDHHQRCIYWLEDVQADKVYEDLQGIQQLADIKFAIEAQYWTHCESFPHNRTIPKSLVDELSGVIQHAAADTLTSDSSTSPFDNEELVKILRLIDNMQGKIGGVDTNSACVIARFMAYFAKGRFYNFYGHPWARLDSDQAIFETRSGPRPFVMRLLSWFLFSAPDIHANEFKHVWVDGIVHKVTWKQFMSKLTDEWQELTLFATVLLNANVAFLAVPGVINSGSSSPSDNSTQTPTGSSSSPQSPAQIASYLSIIMSIGSILLGLLLVRQNRTKRREDVEVAVAFLSRVTRSVLGVESLAYIYSLPYALLMWSMVCFVLAVAFLVFQGTTVVTRALSGFVSLIVAVLVSWSIVAAWNSTAKEH
ncbi:hypothetical protein CERSUDRAFT_115416 [Gelatoporia subvermispora B]|uniref:WW domain-containing protein n=1 Tax=Ceriporiopsis subvermispora (strain B) TaxID=914234 RepID=M2QH98_CERS8|nr:hypothetical protein CERSUDRAFT_115416 [Gelatoporia subvermispora B]